MSNTPKNDFDHASRDEKIVSRSASEWKKIEEANTVRDAQRSAGHRTRGWGGPKFKGLR